MDRPGFAAGVRALFGGFGFILTNPDVWPLALVPVVVALIATTLLGWGAVSFVPGQVRSLMGTHAGGLLSTAVEVFATGLSLLVAALLGLMLAQPLSGPALERIVRRVEQRLGAPAWPPTSVVDDVLRSLQAMLIPYAFGLPLLAALFVINLFVPPAVVVTFPLKMVVTALILAWDLGDYPLSIRGVPIQRRVVFMAHHPAAMLGFGLGLALLGLVPCLFVLVLPAGVAGAARLTVEIERWEATQGRSLDHAAR
ncbi:EI24 domain-containing protein [Chondromyces apiculatus]|uniref:Integral membrane protein n=1 Tax=Chondromyces apiculatus DSM 436 TaxID=1192034 RepID=A0A017SZE2_9BACT|nr:EI24 domain-containing protein [Chondromyces apiculatus]EYF02343.1 integral membrane protein [Chondromyces apiculatus DSM 436]